MIVIAVGIGLCMITLGFVLLTDRVDDLYRNRRHVAPRLDSLPPPFRTSSEQCVTCGRDDGPLSIDNGMCFWCFEKAAQ